MFRKDSFLALYFSLSLLMIFRLLCLLFVSCSLYADDLAIWSSSSPRSLLRWRSHKELSFDWSAGLSTGVFLSIRANVRRPSSQWIPIKLTSNPLLLLGTRLRFNPTPIFLGVTFDRTLSFTKHVFLLKFFPHLKALRCICAFSWGPSKESSILCINLFFGPFSLMLHPHGFLCKRYQYCQIETSPPIG